MTLGTREHPQRLRGIGLALLLVSFYAVMAATLRPGHDWGGDFSLYIMHARNITEGVPYGVTPFVDNPLRPFHSPAAYPPIYPLLLAPVYHVFGLDFIALKLATCLFLPLACLVLYGFARPVLPPIPLFFLIAFTGLNPLLFSLREHVLPIFPFIFFSLSSLWLADLADRKDPLRASGQVWLGIALGLLVYLAYGARSLGVALPAAICLHGLRKHKKLTLRNAVMLGVFLGCALLANRLTGYSDQSYYRVLREFTPSVVIGNAVEYLRLFVAAWGVGYSKLARYSLSLLTLPLAAVAFASRLRHNASAAEFFCLGYLGILLLWPASTGALYVAPLLPLYFFYVLVGSWFLLPPARTGTLIALVLAVSGTYAVGLSRAFAAPAPSGILLPDFQALCATINRTTKKSDLIVFWNPRVLALLTGRRATPYAFGNPGVVWRHIRDSSAAYVVFTRFEREDHNILLPALTIHAAELDEISANPGFVLYRVKSP